MKILSVITLAMIATIACIPVANAENRLNSTEIADLFSNSTVSAYDNLKGAPVSLFYDDNGEVRGMFSTGEIGLTHWWVNDNDQICLKGKDGDLCFVVVSNEGQHEKYLVKEDGTLTLAFSMEEFTKGNVHDY